MTPSNVRKNVFGLFYSFMLKSWLTSADREDPYDSGQGYQTQSLFACRSLQIHTSDQSDLNTLLIHMPDRRWQCNLPPQHPARRSLSSRMFQMEIEMFYGSTLHPLGELRRWEMISEGFMEVGSLPSDQRLPSGLFMNVQSRK